MNPLSLIMEWMPGGSLDKYLYNPDNKISVEQMLKFCRQITFGLRHLHKSNIIHRDLAARNVLLAPDFTCKLSDFGLARATEDAEGGQYTQSNVGPLKWMAPEAIERHVYSLATDIFSLSIVFSEILNREEPYRGVTAVLAATAVLRDHVRPTLPSLTPASLHIITTQMWDPDPGHRPTLDAVVQAIDASKSQI